MKRWWVWAFLLPGVLRAQIDSMVEWWTGLSPNVLGKQLSYAGTADMTVGGVPFYSGGVLYAYTMVLNEVHSRYEYTLNRSDTTGFAGFNFSVSAQRMATDTVFRPVLVLDFFPFLDVRDTTASPAGLRIPLAMTLSLVGRPLPDTLPLHGYFDTAYPLQFMLDPTHTYGTGVWDALWLSGTEPFFLILVDTPAVATLPLPASCAPLAPTAHHYRLVLEDTVLMWDGSSMLLTLDRHFWMVPGCFIVKDSVYRTLSPLVGKEGKLAQSQTYNGSVALESIKPVQEETRPPSGPVRMVFVQGKLYLTGLSPYHRVRVLDISGRQILLQGGGDRLLLPRGVYTLVVEDPRAGSRQVLKGISLR